MKVDSWQHKIEMEQQKIRLELQKGVWSGADTKINGIQHMQKLHMTNSFTPQQIWKIQALVLTHSQV